MPKHRLLLLTLAPLLANACSWTAPWVGGNPITCQQSSDCQPGEICDPTYGLCVAAPVADSGPVVCTVGGQAFDAGAFNPNNACQTCQPSVTTGSFSSLTGFPGPQGCSAGQVCNQGNCAAGCFIDQNLFVAAQGQEPNTKCQVCDPATSMTSWTPQNGVSCGAAGSGLVCNDGGCELGCFIDGAFAANGAVEPANECYSCQAETSPSNWAPVPGTKACDGGYCVAGSCTPACLVGSGLLDAGALNPANDCQECLPGQSSSAYSTLASGTPCKSDGGTFCNGGSCVKECLIGGAPFADQSPFDGGADGGFACCNAALNATAWTPGFAVEATTVAAGRLPQGIAVGPLSKSSAIDLVVANSGDGTVGVILSNGDGTFGAQQPISVGSTPNAIALADFNGDGLMDIAVANSGDGTISVLLNQSDGGFQPAPGSPFAVGPSPSALAVGHFASPTSVDIAVADQGLSGKEISVLLNTGTGSFQPRVTNKVGALPEALVALDLGDAGLQGIAVANHTDGTVTVATSNGDGTFATQSTLTTGSGPASVVAADFNRDGLPDLAVANGGGNTVSVFLNKSGSWSADQGPFGVGGQPQALQAGDFNKDQAPDLAAVNELDGTVSLLLNTTAKGSFTATFSSQVTYPVGSSPVSIASGDFNADGLPDLAVVNNVAKSISLLLGGCP